MYVQKFINRNKLLQYEDGWMTIEMLVSGDES